MPRTATTLRLEAMNGQRHIKANDGGAVIEVGLIASVLAIEVIAFKVVP